jgi:hypothetical protein
MDLVRIADLGFHFQHRHSDGTIGEFEPVHSHHDAADHDPERAWATGTIYRCTSCDEEIAVEHDDPTVIPNDVTADPDR